MAFESLEDPPAPRPHRPAGSVWVPVAFWLSIVSLLFCGLTSPIPFIMACAVGTHEIRQGRRPHRVTYWTIVLSLTGMVMAVLLVLIGQFV